MRVENEYIVKNLDRVQFETQEKLHQIHELLDPQNCIHSVGKTFDHTIDLVKQSIAKLHSLVAQSDVKSREILEVHAREMREMQDLNDAQADRLRELTMAIESNGDVSCQHTEIILQENHSLK